MQKVSYTNMKLKIDKSFNTFDFEGTKIEVLNYLPIEDKYDLIMITLQKAEENGIYHPLKLDIYFHLHLIYMYSNLSFTDKQKEDELKLYDCLKSSGFMYHFMNAIDDDEYNYLFEMMQDTINNYRTYRNTAAAVLQSIIQDLPKNAQIAADIVDSFDKNKFKEVVDFAEAANGGRPIRGAGARANMIVIDEAVRPEGQTADLDKLIKSNQGQI